jgi:3-oxoacyl-[acyl-carrier protein] reductase
MDRHLFGQVALVTGASRGIGRAIAIRLASRGAKVACVATSADRCEETVAACRERDVDARAYGVDVASTDGVKALVDQIVADMGGLHLVVNNAGITRDQLMLRMSEEDFDRVIEVNLKGTWNFAKASARTLLKCKGRLINISSVVGVIGNAGQANYAASKAGVIGLTKSLAKEFAGRGVCVNAIAPGFIQTDMTAAIDENATAALTAAIPLGTLGEVEHIAAAVDFLAGPGGDYITGQTLVVDGGMSL